MDVNVVPVYPYTNPAAPLNSPKSYPYASFPCLPNSLDIVPVRNRITTTVVAIQNGPYRSGFPSRTSRKLLRKGKSAAQQRRRTDSVSTSKNCE